jgi:Protein of unknown function (DUF3712)
MCREFIAVCTPQRDSHTCDRISGIAFNVPSNIKGINSFDGTAALSNVSITGSGGNGGNQFIVSPLTTTLQNPSNISLLTTGIALPVDFNGVQVRSTSSSIHNSDSLTMTA